MFSSINRVLNWIPTMFKDPADWSRRAIFFASSFYALVILGGAICYMFNLFELTGRTIADVPIEMLWFGSLGAITISLQALFEYQDNLQTKFNLWHLGRPIIGAILGLMSFLMLRTLVAVGSSETITSDIPEGITLFPYRILAFVVGYREATFRELMKRVIDVILGPGDREKTDPEPQQPQRRNDVDQSTDASQTPPSSTGQP